MVNEYSQMTFFIFHLVYIQWTQIHQHLDKFDKRTTSVDANRWALQTKCVVGVLHPLFK